MSQNCPMQIEKNITLCYVLRAHAFTTYTRNVPLWSHLYVRPALVRLHIATGRVLARQ